jgi:hypothetical protein
MPAKATEAYVDRLVANIAERLECQAYLIRSAKDPIAMLNILRPILCHPRVNDGEIPPLFRNIAEAEVRRRAATAPSATQH